MTNHNPNHPKGKNQDPATSRKAGAQGQPDPAQGQSQLPQDQQGLQGQHANQDHQRNDRRDGQDHEDRVPSSRRDD